MGNRTEVVVVESENKGMKILLDSFLSLACDVVNTDGGSVMFVDKEKNELVVKAAAGSNKSDAIGKTVKVGERVSGRAAETKQSILVQGKIDVQKDEKFRKMKEFEPISSGMSVPIIFENNLFGVLNLKRTERETPLDWNDVDIAKIFVREMGIAFNKILSL